MVSTPCQKWFSKTRVFCQKAQNFVHFGAFDLVQISLACGQNTYQIMYGESLVLISYDEEVSSFECILS